MGHRDTLDQGLLRLAVAGLAELKTEEQVLHAGAGDPFAAVGVNDGPERDQAAPAGVDGEVGRGRRNEATRTTLEAVHFTVGGLSQPASSGTVSHCRRIGANSPLENRRSNRPIDHFRGRWALR